MLFLNIKHAVVNGLIRRVCGENHHNSKLTTIDVTNIRYKYKLGGITLKELGLIYNVSHTTVSNVVNNLIWK